MESQVLKKISNTEWRYRGVSIIDKHKDLLKYRVTLISPHHDPTRRTRKHRHTATLDEMTALIDELIDQKRWVVNKHYLHQPKGGNQ